MTKRLTIGGNGFALPEPGSRRHAYISSKYGASPAVIESRIMARTGKSGDCWLWRGYLRNGQHGAISVKGKSVYVHRIAYEIYVGIIPMGLLVCHHCDVGRCVNPSHLFIGDDLANMRDMISKGRERHSHKLGELHHAARLSDAQLAELRSLSKPVKNQRELAKLYGVSQSTIWRIVNNEVRTRGTGVCFSFGRAR